MRTRTVIAPALLAGLTVSLLSATSATAADGDCAVVVTQAATVSITSTSMYVPAALRDAPAACASYASFDVLRSDNANVGIVIFDDGRGDDSWDLSTSDGPGRYRLQFRNGSGQDYDDLAPTSTSNEVVAKFSSRLSATKVERAKKTARVSVKASQYRYFSGYEAVSGRRVVLEKKTATGWTAVKTVKTGKKGLASATVASTKTTKWRARLLESTTAWGAASGSTSPKGSGVVAQTPTAPVPAAAAAPAMQAQD